MGIWTQLTRGRVPGRSEGGKWDGTAREWAQLESGLSLVHGELWAGRCTSELGTPGGKGSAFRSHLSQSLAAGRCAHRRACTHTGRDCDHLTRTAPLVTGVCEPLAAQTSQWLGTKGIWVGRVTASPPWVQRSLLLLFLLLLLCA